MKKWRFFLSILKERDWLEEMAAQGFVLTNITAGIRYHFKEAEPCEKVFEIERFAISGHATVQELNARKFAMDVAAQSGWEVVTHDEEMNYYFMKDKAGDETDEFYDEEETRKGRAERYRRRYSYEIPVSSLAAHLILSLIYVVLFLFLRSDSEVLTRFMWFYVIITLFEIAFAVFYIWWGQFICQELSLSREEWVKRKRFSVKKHFNKVQQLRSFLQEQSACGLSLIGYENGKYLFAEDTHRYDYFVDTKSCLKKRLKEHGISYKDDLKDWSAQSPEWYEMSIADAEQYGLQPVGVIGKTVLIYKRAYSEEAFPWENGNENISRWKKPTVIGGLILLGSFVVGFAIGYIGTI